MISEEQLTMIKIQCSAFLIFGDVDRRRNV
jgi:hypothetical protein